MKLVDILAYIYKYAPYMARSLFKLIPDINLPSDPLHEQLIDNLLIKYKMDLWPCVDNYLIESGVTYININSTWIDDYDAPTIDGERIASIEVTHPKQGVTVITIEHTS